MEKEKKYVKYQGKPAPFVQVSTQCGRCGDPWVDGHKCEKLLIPMEEKIFTIKEIKKAFWDTFHKSGDLWFSDFEDDCEIATNSFWERFLKILNNRYL